VVQQGHKQKQSGQGSAEGAGREIQAAHVGHRGDLGSDGGRAFVVGAAGKAREAFFAEQKDQRVDADGVAGGGEFALHVIDREIAFAHGHGYLADAIPQRSGLRSAKRLTEEGSAFFWVVAELMTEDAKGARGVTEAAGDIGGGLLVDEEGAEGFVLALQGELGVEKELLVGRCCYVVCSAGLHIQIVL
jgi:hypothetical protein